MDQVPAFVTGANGLQVHVDAGGDAPGRGSPIGAEDLRVAPADRVAGGGRMMPPAGGVWWMHLLVLVALMVAGAAAGLSGFAAHGWGNLAGARACLANLGVSFGEQLPSRLGQDVPALRACTAGYERSLSWAMVAGMGGTPALAWLLAICVDARRRRHLLRKSAVRHDSAALRKVRAGFEDWCDDLDLRGRRRPRLLLGRPGRLTGQAFTLAVPWARPLVMIPAGYAYLPDSADQAAVVIAHELAHVRSRDVAWASLTRAARVVGLLLLLVAVAPLATRPTDAAFFSPFLLEAFAMSTLTWIMGAAVLRRREHAADHWAMAATGNHEAFGCALGLPVTDSAADTGPGRARAPRAVWPWFRGWFAEHPAPTARVLAAARLDEGWLASFVAATAIGALAMFIAQALDTVLGGLFSRTPDPRPLTDLSFAVGGLVWAAVLVPAWSRPGPAAATRTAMTRRAGLAGSTLGLTAGYFLPPPGIAWSHGQSNYAGHYPLAVAWWAVMSLGVSAITAGLATTITAHDRVRRAAATTTAVLGATTVAATAFGLGYLVLAQHVGSANPALDRLTLIVQGACRWWRWTPTVLILVALVCALAARTIPRPGLTTRPPGERVQIRRCKPGSIPHVWHGVPAPILQVAAAAMVASAVVITAVTQARIGGIRTDDASFLLAAQRWWACAAAGCAVTTLILIGSHAPASSRSQDQTPSDTGGGQAPPPTFAHALLAGAAVAVTSGLIQFLRDAVTGRSGRNLGNLVNFIREPLWLLCLLLVMTLPWVLLVGDPLARFRLRTPVGVGRWARVPIALTTVGSVCALMLAGPLASITISPGDTLVSANGIQHTGSPAPPFLRDFPAAPAPPGNTTDPGRPLQPGDVLAVLAFVQHSLPQGWTPDPTSGNAGPHPGILPTSCADLFLHDRAADQARPKTADLTRAFQLPPAQVPPEGINLAVGVTSYRSTSMAGQALNAIRAEGRQCPQFSAPMPVGGGRMHLTITEDPPVTLPHPGLSQTLTNTARGPVSAITISSAIITILVGHNVIAISATCGWFGPTTPPARLTLLRDLRRTVVDTTLAALSTPANAGR